MDFVDVHSVRCGTCGRNAVIGVDDERRLWVFCWTCRRAITIVEFIAAHLAGEIPFAGPFNHNN